MTAEIVIMNKLAVALAADSAVTISYQGGDKIYNSANKLFMLSNNHPIGIMIYGAAEFMEIPWETIIKIYRTELGQQTFPTLGEYAEHFLKFLHENNDYLFTEEQQTRYYSMSIAGYLRMIRGEIDGEDGEIQKLMTQKSITDDDVAQVVAQVINRHYQEWEQLEMLPAVDADYIQEVTQQVQIIFPEAQKSLFDGLPVSEDAMEQLKSISVFLATKMQFPEWSSGMVFAGFGERDIFPSTVAFQFEAIISNQLKYIESGNTQISLDNPAAIVPFAQSEMVSAFMEGINPEYKQVLAQYLGALFIQYPEVILEVFHDIDDDKKAALLGKLQESGRKLLANFIQEIENYQTQYHVSPVISNVANLPVSELAEMAEALVNLTSFKRRVSTQAETVAGPTDVAIISKKDGFIWIKQKQYFDIKYNPHFLTRHNREDSAGGDIK
jgi:hypothetical protein